MNPGDLMKPRSLCPFVISALLTAAVLCMAQTPKSPAARKHLLVIGHSAGFTHDSISHGMVALGQIGEKSGLFDVTLRTDVQLITKKKLDRNAKNLDYFDAIFFYTTG